MMKKRAFNKNEGIALITVLIGVMFCLLLTSTMLRVSLLGLQSRNINNQVSDNYYDAESVLDSIRLNLQNTAAKAWATTTNETSSYNFVVKAYYLLTNKDYETMISAGSLSVTDPDDVEFVKNNLTNNYAIQGGTVESIGAIEKFIGETGNLEGLTIRQVAIRYENPTTHMVSFVTTDITIRAPLYASKKKYPLASYSMFAGCGATLNNAQGMAGGQYGNPNQFGFFEQEGNVYIGYSGSNTINNNEATAITINNRETFILTGNNVVINGSIYVNNWSNLQLTGAGDNGQQQDVEIRGKIYLGQGSHLIIGTNTNLRCRDIVIEGKSVLDTNDSTGYRLAKANAKEYHGSPYYCFSKFTHMNNKGDIIADVGNMHDTTYNDYVVNKASIVYISPTNVNSSKAYDALVTGAGVVTKQDGTKLTVSLDLNDSDLFPKPRRSTQNADGTGYESKYGKMYDDYFLDIVDLEYFEAFMFDSSISSTTCNCKVDNKIKASKYNPNQEKNEPTTADSFEAATATRELRKNDDGTTWTDPDNGQTKNEEFKCLTFEGINYSYTTYDGTTHTYKNPRVELVFTASQNSGNGNLVHSTDRPFVLSSYDVTFHVDKGDSNYCGIIFTSQFVELKKDTGYCEGKSLLSLDTDPDLKNLKKLMDAIGSHMASTGVGSSNYKYVIFNNLFKGGMKRFYEKPSSNNNNNYQIDTTHNAIMDLVDTDNYEKK